jgi:hypothetical protein
MRNGRGMENGQVCVPFLAAARANVQKRRVYTYTRPGVYIHSQAFHLL